MRLRPTHVSRLSVWQAHRWVAQNRWTNRLSRCRVGADSCGPKEPYRWGSRSPCGRDTFWGRTISSKNLYCYNKKQNWLMWLRDFECRPILVVIITLHRLQPGRRSCRLFRCLTAVSICPFRFRCRLKRERNFLTDFLVTPEFENGTMVHWFPYSNSPYSRYSHIFI